jgi:ribosome biogenesis protein NSA2
MHQQRTNKQVEEAPREGAVPGYLLDRKEADRGKVLSNTIKQKKKQRAGKWDVPLPKGMCFFFLIS